MVRRQAEAERLRGQRRIFVADAHTDWIFQHERLIHLIVTVLFAILAVISILASLLIQEWAVLLLCLMFFVLLIPYIRHYYILENGVQKLYEYYDQIYAADEK